jgi:hypothetical protein
MPTATVEVVSPEMEVVERFMLAAVCFAARIDEKQLRLRRAFAHSDSETVEVDALFPDARIIRIGEPMRCALRSSSPSPGADSFYSATAVSHSRRI